MKTSGTLKLEQKQRSSAIIIMTVGIIMVIVFALAVEMSKNIRFLIIANGVSLILFSAYVLIFGVRKCFRYDESGFTYKPKIGSERSYSYYDIEAAYNYEINYKNIHQTGIKLIMKDGKKYDINNKFTESADMIMMIKQNMYKSEFYNNRYCYKHNINEL